MNRKVILLSLVAVLIFTACSKDNKETVLETQSESKVETKVEETKVEEIKNNSNNSVTTDNLNIKQEGSKIVAHFHNYKGFEEFTNNNEGEFVYNPDGDFVLVKVRVTDPNDNHKGISKIIGKLKISSNQLLENKVINTCGGNCPVEVVSDISNDRMIEICNQIKDILNK